MKGLVNKKHFCYTRNPSSGFIFFRNTDGIPWDLLKKKLREPMIVKIYGLKETSLIWSEDYTCESDEKNFSSPLILLIEKHSHDDFEYVFITYKR